MKVHSFSFCLLEKYLSFNSEWLSCQVVYSWREISYLQHFDYIMPLPPGKVSTKKSADSLVGVPLYVTSFFLAVFRILLLPLTFDILMSCCESVLEISGIPGSDVCFLPQVRKVFSHYFFK